MTLILFLLRKSDSLVKGDASIQTIDTHSSRGAISFQKSGRLWKNCVYYQIFSQKRRKEKEVNNFQNSPISTPKMVLWIHPGIDNK